MSETNRFYYQQWIQILLIIVCLTVFSGFVYLSLTAAWGMSPARDIGIGVFLFAWLLCGLACLWGLNKVLGYVELNQDAIIECYILFYKKRIKYSEIESSNITNSQNTRIPFDGLNNITDISKIFALLIASPAMVIGNLLKPMTIELNLTNNSGRKFQFLQHIDKYCLYLETNLPKYQLDTTKNNLLEYQINQKYMKYSLFGLMLLIFMLLIFVYYLFKEGTENIAQNLIMIVISLGMIEGGIVEVLAYYDQHKSYKLLLTKNCLSFTKLKDLTRYYEARANIPHWLEIPLDEITSVKRAVFPYQIRRKYDGGFVINSKVCQINIYDLIPKSTHFLKSIKQLMSQSTSVSKEKAELNNNDSNQNIEYKIIQSWFRYASIFCLSWAIAAVSIFVVIPQWNTRTIIIFLIPFLIFISKFIKLCRCRSISAQLEGNKLTFKVGGFKIFNFFIRDIGFTNQTIDLSDLVKVCYCTYPDSTISGLAERFTLKFKSKKDIQILNMFENGGDLFNRLVDICRYNYSRTSK